MSRRVASLLSSEKLSSSTDEGGQSYEQNIFYFECDLCLL